jgi:hypothetical protein
MTVALESAPESPEPLDYDALYARYLASLVDDLRGFRAAAPGLELWVPDEDPFASVRNLLDAAASVGRQRVRVRLSAKTLAELGPDPERLLSMARAHGDAHLSLDGAGAVLDVSGLVAPAARRAEAGPAAPATVTGAERPASGEPSAFAARCAAAASGLDLAAREAAAYRPALERAAAAPAHRGRPLAVSSGQVLVRASSASAELRIAVDPSTHRLEATSFEARDPLAIGLLESLCRAVSGLPLLEAAEHGTLRLEQLLRGAAPRPVAGIVLPEAVHPLFRWARDLLVQALADYRRQTGFAEVHSRHDQRPGEAWQRASDAERRTWLARELAAALAARGIDPSSARVDSIRHDVRVELLLEPPAGTDAPALVMDLERALQAQVDRRLEVYVTERRDRNAQRRLTLLGGAA